MANGPVFPAFLKIEHQADNSAKSSFLAEVAAITGDAQRRFEKAFDEVGRVIDRTSSKLNRGKFKLDLDVSGLRAATAEADYAVQKVTALRDAAIKLAMSSNDTSRSTKTFVDALRAQTVEAERARSASYEQLQTYGRLQEAVSKLTRENHALAQSYRDTFMEQAKAENAAFRSQQAANALSAPGLNRPAKSARDSASVFENNAYAPKADPRTGLEAFLAGKGAVDSAVMSVTTLESVLGRVQRKGKEVAAALGEVERAAADAAKERIVAEQAAAAASDKVKAEAAAELQRLGQAADALNARLNPAVAVQQRYNTELEHARTLLKAGVIDQGLYGQAVERATNEQAAALRLLAAAQDQQGQAAKRGTTETQNVINSTRALRVAGIQAGQQIQDMAIQFQMGTNATTVFAQQVPQLAFALSGLEGNANKTLSKVGQFSTFLAGPWGAAILIAGVALVPLIDKILGTGDAADEAKGKTYDFANGLNVLSLSANNAADAMTQLSNEMRNAIAVQGDFLAGKANIANQSVKQLQSIYDAEDRELAALKKRATAFNPLERLSAAETYRMGALIQNRKPLQNALSNARTADIAAREALAQQRGIEAADPRAAATGRYNRAVGDLRSRFQQSQNDPVGAAASGRYITESEYQSQFSKLTATKDKEIDSLKKTREKKGADPVKAAERAARAAQRLGEFGEDAGKKIANIGDSFRDIPPEVERINKASRELDDIISDLMNRKPEGFKELIDQAQGLKDALPDMAFGRVMRQITEDAQQQVQLQMLILQGRDGEAQALQQIYQIEQNLGPLRRDQKEQIISTGIAMQRINEQMQRAQEIQSVFLDSTRSVRNEVEAILGGYGKLSDLGATLKRSFQQIQGKVLTEQIFGDLFRDMDRYVKDKTGIGSSVDMMAKETVRAGEAAGTLADEMIAAAQRIAGAGSSATSAAAIGSSAISGGWSNIGIPPLLKAPANENYDPNAPIVVEAKKPGGTRTVNDLRPEEYFHKFGQAFGGKFAAILEPLLGKKLAGNLGGVLGGVLEGQATTGTGFGAILGGLKELKGLPEGLTKGLGKAFSGAQTGAAVAGIGNALGLKMSNTGAQIGGAIGKFIPIPGGDIIGAIAGGLIGKLFGGTKKGFAVASNGSVSTGGNSKQAEAAGSSAGALNESLGSIAKAFGSSLGNYAVSIGSRSSGYISVSASGSSSVADKGYKKGQIGKDIIYDGKDMEEALRVALQNAIQDGAIAGIKAGSKRLLSLGSNIDAQVEKALKFEGVFKSLRAIKDPMGAALDELNTEFKNLIDIFKEAGASTTEFGQLEELYGIQRKEAIEQVTQAMTSSLKALKEELTIGSDYFSLRDRKASALDVYNPLKDRVAAGDTTAFDAFSDAARNLISIEREISGSTSPFFALLQEVTNLSNNALNSQTASISATTASDSPFAALAAQNAATASAIDSQTEALLAGIGGRLDLLNANLIAALRSQSMAVGFDNRQSMAARNYW